MTAPESIAEFAGQPTVPAITRLLTAQTREVIARVNVFRQWTREHLISREPSAAELRQHDQVCKLLIRMLGLLQTILMEPGFPDQPLADEVAFLIRRLKEDWEMLHNPMTESEAKELIPDLFMA